MGCDGRAGFDGGILSWKLTANGLFVAVERHHLAIYGLHIHQFDADFFGVVVGVGRDGFYPTDGHGARSDRYAALRDDVGAHFELDCFSDRDFARLDFFSGFEQEQGACVEGYVFVENAFEHGGWRGVFLGAGSSGCEEREQAAEKDIFHVFIFVKSSNVEKVNLLTVDFDIIEYMGGQVGTDVGCGAAFAARRFYDVWDAAKVHRLAIHCGGAFDGDRDFCAFTVA